MANDTVVVQVPVGTVVVQKRETDKQVQVETFTHITQVSATAPPGPPGDISRLLLITTDYLPISNDKITLPSIPQGDILWGIARVKLHDGSIEEHDGVTVVNGNKAFFSDAAGSLNGLTALVSYLGVALP